MSSGASAKTKRSQTRASATVNHGAGWIIFEESYHQKSRKLVSIISARRSTNDVSVFMQQIYVDRASTIEGRLSYKKSSKSAPYQVTMGKHCNPMHIGHDPWLVGLYAEKISLRGNILEFSYRILVNSDNPLRPIFEERSQSLEVDV